MIKIKNELHWYRVEPQVYRTGVISEVTIIANDPIRKCVSSSHFLLRFLYHPTEPISGRGCAGEYRGF
ncbi:MAG TPA: hypothetical protein PKN17_03765 [Bacillota bacterium]|nr:hypothetical protein [Bacillota bacterium]